jgi:hypothetical protein
MVNFKPQLLYPQEKPWYPLNRRLGEPQSQAECFREEKNLLILLGFEPPDCPAHSPAAIPTTLYRLPMFNNMKYFLATRHADYFKMRIYHIILMYYHHYTHNRNIKGEAKIQNEISY